MVSAACSALRSRYDKFSIVDVDHLAPRFTEKLSFLHIPKTGGEKLDMIHGRLQSHITSFAARHGNCSAARKCVGWHVPPRYYTPNP